MNPHDRSFLAGLLAEAADLGDDRLVAHLTEALAKVDHELAQLAEVEPQLDAATDALAEAAAAKSAAIAARNLGSLDRKQALRLAEELEASTQAASIRAREVERLRGVVGGHRSRIDGLVAGVRRQLDDATRAANALAIAIVKRRPYTLTPTRDPMFDALAESRVDVAATIRSVYPPAGARSAPDAAEVESEFRAACDRRRAERAAMAARAAADAARLAG